MTGFKFRREWDGSTERIELPALPEVGCTEPQWVDVKRVLSRTDELKVEKLSRAGVGLVNGQATADLETFMTAIKTARLSVAVVAWSLDEPIGNFELLEEPWIEILNQRLDELYDKPLTKDEAKNSEGGLLVSS